MRVVAYEHQLVLQQEQREQLHELIHIEDRQHLEHPLLNQLAFDRLQRRPYHNLFVKELQRVPAVQPDRAAVEAFDALLVDLSDAVYLEAAVDLLDIVDLVFVDLQALHLDDVQDGQDQRLEEREERQVAGNAVHSLGHADLVDRRHSRNFAEGAMQLHGVVGGWGAGILVFG